MGSFDTQQFLEKSVFILVGKQANFMLTNQNRDKEETND